MQAFNGAAWASMRASRGDEAENATTYRNQFAVLHGAMTALRSGTLNL